MINTKLSQIIQNRRNQSANGFTMVEALIAGVLLVSVMTAVAQMSVSALAGSKNQATRVRIEAAVSNDIQLLQQADSYLTYDSIDPDKQDEACDNPTAWLIGFLSDAVPSDTLQGLNIKREIITGATDDVVEVNYKFNGPESGIGNEYRMIELNPNFSAQCYTT